jgi:hypothetical protein
LSKPLAAKGRFKIQPDQRGAMSGSVKSAALLQIPRCTCEQMLRQQAPARAMAAESASYQFKRDAPNGSVSKTSHF